MMDPNETGPAYLEESVAMELLKLLLQVAWADDKLHALEAESLTQLADALLPNDRHFEAVHAWIEGTLPLPAPDLQLLRAHKEDVLLEVRRVIFADQVFAKEEGVMLAQLEQLLTTR
ncbi:MAG: hypothetical protein ACO3JL_07545 [Myxococcota bacterium]